MRHTALVVIVLGVLLSHALGVYAVGPGFAFRDLPNGLTLGHPGLLSASLHLTSSGWRGAISGSLAEWVDVGFAASSESLFDPELRLQLIRDLLPLQAALAFRPTEATFAATLLLGPVDLTLGRDWKLVRARAQSGESRWLYAQWAASQSLTVLVGLTHQGEDSGRSWGAILGLRLSSPKDGLRGASIIYRNGSLSLAIGGIL